MTVSELEARMQHRELLEWMAYFTMEPFGPQWEDYRAGVLAAVMAQTMGGARDAKPTDFFNIYEHRNKPATDGYESLAMFKRLADEGLQGSQ